MQWWEQAGLNLGGVMEAAEVESERDGGED